MRGGLVRHWAYLYASLFSCRRLGRWCYRQLETWSHGWITESPGAAFLAARLDVQINVRPGQRACPARMATQNWPTCPWYNLPILARKLQRSLIPVTNGSPGSKVNGIIRDFPHPSPPGRVGIAWSLYWPNSWVPLFTQLTLAEDAFSYRDVSSRHVASLWHETKMFTSSGWSGKTIGWLILFKLSLLNWSLNLHSMGSMAKLYNWLEMGHSCVQVLASSALPLFFHTLYIVTQCTMQRHKPSSKPKAECWIYICLTHPVFSWSNATIPAFTL